MSKILPEMTVEPPPPVVTSDTATVIQVAEDTKSFNWDNVGFTVQVKSGKTKVDKVLLSANTGAVTGGQVIGIMGGSGAGKSTLLNCLSGRIGPGKLEGTIQFNGLSRDPSVWRSQCAFVEQDDLMFSNLSVSETLRFSALLRLPYSMSNEEKFKKVENIIMELGLDGCRHVRIGNAEEKGISGGERKRVSIAMELVTNPDILFLDEPTSGLDAFTAINLIKTLKKIAVLHKTIVIMTIHQPRTDILECLDKILLLSMGKTIWYGRTENALTHFGKLGFLIPPNTNPSDFFSDITTLDRRTPELQDDSTKRINLFQKAWEQKMVHSPLSAKVDLKESDSKTFRKISYPSPMYYEILTLLKRAMLDVFRDSATLGATLGQGVFITIVLGFIFFRLPLSLSGIQDRLGVTFFICVNQTFGTVMPTINVFPNQKIIIKRERAAGTYRSFSGFISKVLSTLPLVYAGSLLLSIPIYWMIGFQNDITKYLTFILIILIHSHTANSLGIAIGSFVPNATVGQIIGPLIIVVFLIFGGQFVNLEKLPASLKWIQYLSFITYSNKALSQNEMNGLTFTYPCPYNTSVTCDTPGSEILKQYALDFPSLWLCILINVGLSIVCLLVGAIGFAKTTAPLMRLSTDPPTKSIEGQKINSF